MIGSGAVKICFSQIQLGSNIGISAAAKIVGDGETYTTLGYNIGTNSYMNHLSQSE